MPYVDEDGNEISVHRYIELCRSEAVGRVLLESTVPTSRGDVDVKTIWAGIVVPELDVRAFGTAIKPTGAGMWREVEQYDAKDAALAGHARWVAQLGGVQS